MYSIYADGTCIYSDLSVSEELCLIDPKLELEDSAAGSLEITIPPSNVGYSLVKRMTSEITVKQDGEEIWSGRVLSEKEDYWKCRALYCEGELAYLNDTTQPQAEYHDITVQGFLEILLNIHNAKVSADKQFQVGIVTVTDSNDSLYRYTNFENTIECINDKLIGRLGGHLRIRKENGVRYLDYLKDYPNTNSQVIYFGENLLDFTKNYELSELATVILPLGARLDISEIEALEQYTDVSSVNNDSPYVISENAYSQYGWIEKIVHWDDVTEPSNLLSKAREYLSEVQFENMQLEITALDMHCLDVQTEQIKLLDEIRVVSAPHGLDRLFPITKMSIPLSNPEDTLFTLGTNVRLSLTAINNATNSEILARIENIPKKSAILEEAQNNASRLINNATNGYITIRSQAGETQEILITDTPDYRTAQKVWRWNVGGLGFSSTGYSGTYGLAMTMDGSIVASRINTGTMYADRIKGGSLTLGGSDNTNGVLYLKNQNGTIICQMDKNGFYTSSTDGYWLRMSNGTITGGRGNDECGFINASAVIHNITTDEYHNGFIIKADAINLVTRELATIDNMDPDSISIIGCTGSVNVMTEGGGSIQLSFINGICTSAL